MVMTPDDRSHLANIPIDQPCFHEWDGACNNPELIAATDDATREQLEELRKVVDTLSIDYDVQTEERDRLNESNRTKRRSNK